MATMRKFGDWDAVMNLARNMPQAIEDSLDRSLMQVTLKAERMAVKFLQTQELNWAPLSSKYMSRKARKGLSTKILIATSTYFQSITSQVKNNVGFAGVLKQVKDRDGNNVADIAMILEYGSIGRNIPPRRLWSVVFQNMHVFLRKERIFEKNVLADLHRLAGR